MPLFPCVSVRACACVRALEHVQMPHPCWAFAGVLLMEESTKRHPFLERINYCLGKLCLSPAYVCKCVFVRLCAPPYLRTSMKPTPALLEISSLWYRHLLATLACSLIFSRVHRRKRACAYLALARQMHACLHGSRAHRRRR